MDRDDSENSADLVWAVYRFPRETGDESSETKHINPKFKMESCIYYKQKRSKSRRKLMPIYVYAYLHVCLSYLFVKDEVLLRFITSTEERQKILLAYYVDLTAAWPLGKDDN